MSPAGAAAAADWRGPHLLGLVERLRDAGFAVGTSELVDATQLLLRLAERDGAPPPDRLASALRPLLCKQSERRADFDAVYARWAETLAPSPPRPAPQPQPLQQAEQPTAPRWAAWLVLGVLVAGIGAMVLFDRLQPAPVPAPQRQASAPAAAAAPSAAVPTPAASAAAPIEGYVPLLRSSRQLWPGWAWLLAALPLLAFVTINLPVLWLAPSRARRDGRPLRLDPAPLESEARRLVPPLPEAARERLARHVRSGVLDLRRAVRRPRIDARRTVEATLRQRGVPALRYAPTPVHPSYLVLADAAHERDPRGRLFYQWALRLQQQGLDVRILLLRLDGEAVRVGPHGAADADPRWQPLARLPAPPPGQRLVVVGDGDPFVDADGRWRSAATLARLHRWPDRALFTPVELRDWGAREAALERRETPVDAGFTVLPLDESALVSWADLVLTGQLSAITLADPQRFPAQLRRGDRARWLDDKPPKRADVERLVVELRLYLGERGLRWLAALALAPVVRWDLTLLLGRTALAMDPRLADEDSLSKALALHYRRLVRLPWLQGGRLPEWLRLRLLLELPRAGQRALQERVRTLLGQIAPGGGSDGIPLGFEQPPRRGPAGRGRRTAADGDADAIYLGTMAGLTAEDLLLRAPAEWDWADRLLPPARGWRERSARLRERVRARWARRAWVDGLPHLGPRKAAVWLAPLLLLPLAALLAWAARQPATADAAVGAPFVAAALPADVVDAPVPIVAAAFSADGGTLVVAGDGRLQRTDLATGAARSVAIDPLGAPFAAAALSADGSELVGVRGRTLSAWAIDGERPNHTDDITIAPDAIAVAPAGERIAVAYRDGGVALWERRSGQGQVLPRTNGAAVDVVASADGAWVAERNAGGAIAIWRAIDGTPAAVRAASAANARQIAFVGSGAATRLLVVVPNGSATLLDPATGSLAAIGTLPPPPEGAPRCLAGSADGERLASWCDGGGTLRLLSARAGHRLPTLVPDVKRDFDAIAISADGSRVAAIDGPALTIWTDGGVSATRVASAPRPAFVGDLGFIGADRLAGVDSQDVLRFWDARTAAALTTVFVGTRSAVAFGGDRIAIAGVDRTVRLRDATGTPVGTPFTPPGTARVSELALDGQGRRLAIGGEDGSVTIVEGGRPRSAVATRRGIVTALAFSADGSRLAIGREDAVSDVDVATLAELGRWAVPGDGPERREVRVVRYASQRLVAVDDTGTVRQWSLADGRPVGSPLAGGSFVRSAVISGDGLDVALLAERPLRAAPANGALRADPRQQKAAPAPDRAAVQGVPPAAQPDPATVVERWRLDPPAASTPSFPRDPLALVAAALPAHAGWWLFGAGVLLYLLHAGIADARMRRAVAKEER